MNLVDLNPDLKSGVFQFLSIESFVSLKRTCKRAVNPAQDAIYWKKMWNCFYSSINAQNDRVQIKTFEEELKKQRLLSKKFQVCVQLKCEKMGSFKGCLKNAEPIILTTCLRDLVKKNMSVDIHTRIALATALLNYKANPLQNINVVMEDYPLRLAVLHNDYEMVSLFVRYIDKNRENINLLAELHSQLKDQIKNTAVGVLNEFLNAL